jgi:hypothetical protein
MNYKSLLDQLRSYSMKTYGLVAGAAALLVAVGVFARYRAHSHATSALSSVAPNSAALKAPDLPLLNSGQLADPDAAPLLARPLTDVSGDVAKLKGNFKGVMRSRVGPEVVDLDATLSTKIVNKQVQMELKGRMSAGASKKDLDIKAPLKSVLAAKSAPQSYLVQVGSKSYFQLLYVAKEDRWVGNYFRRNPAGRMINSGVVELKH